MRAMKMSTTIRPMKWSAAALIGAGLLVVLATLPGCSNGDGAGLLVGAAKRDITPTAETAPPDGSVFLGGYGLGPERLSTGVLEPIFVRAFVVSGGPERGPGRVIPSRAVREHTGGQRESLFTFCLIASTGDVLTARARWRESV